MNSRSQGGGYFSKILVLLLLLGLAFGLVMYCSDASPSQAWRRIVDGIERILGPAPAPNPPVAPVATPVPTPVGTPAPLATTTPIAASTPAPVSTPTPTPVATPTPVDPVAWLISHKSRWPREVALLEAVKFPVVQDGKISGSIEVPAASKVSVLEITSKDVLVSLMGGQRRLPHPATDLATVAQVTMERARMEALQPRLPKPTFPGRPTLGGASKIKNLDAWTAVPLMTPGINIGNTFDCTTGWETGWGSPLITKGFIERLAQMGFKSVRVPVAWDTYSDHGRITDKEFKRIDEIVNWILEAGMFCVVNIHWDGGWIDSDDEKKFPDTFRTFSKDAEKKFRSYWTQIARHYADKGEKLLFEGLNEQTNFENEGSLEKSYATLTRVNQIFIDTVRKTGGNNAQRLLIVTGYSTDFDKASRKESKLPKDSVPGKLFISVHYYTPWTFVGMDGDASWGKMQRTWGSKEDVKLLNDLFDRMEAFCKRTNTPAYVGEFSMCSRKPKDSSIRWTTSVYQAALKRKMVPVLWDTGGAVSRNPPYTPDEGIAEMLKGKEPPPFTESASEPE